MSNEADIDSEFLSPSVLGRHASPSMVASTLNRMLEAEGLQVKDGLNWRLTSSGEAFGRPRVTSYRNRDGTPKIVLRWKPSVLAVIAARRSAGTARIRPS